MSFPGIPPTIVYTCRAFLASSQTRFPMPQAIHCVIRYAYYKQPWVHHWKLEGKDDYAASNNNKENR